MKTYKKLITELSDNVLTNYKKKAQSQANSVNRKLNNFQFVHERDKERAEKRKVGVYQATRKLKNPVIAQPESKYIKAEGKQEKEKFSKFKPASQFHTQLTPDEYFKHAETQNGWHRNKVSKVNVEKLKDRMRENKPIDPTYLDYDVDNKKIVGQEGRHRATAAKELGIKHIPVVVFFRDKHGNFVDTKDHVKHFEQFRSKIK